MKLGADLFSVRFNEWDAFQYLDYAAQIGLNAVLYPDPSFLGRLDDDHLRKVKAHADKLGITVEVGMDSICETSTRFSNAHGTAAEQLSRILHAASIMGTPAVRCLLGSNEDRHTAAIATHMQNTIATCRAVREQALDLGIKIAIENHAGDMLGRELKALVEEAGTDYVGVCIDSGNPLWVAESPFVTLAHVAPYVLMSHIRDTAVWPHPRGAVAQWVAMGDGNIGIDKWAKQYITQCPNTIFTLEILTSLAPKVLNYLDPAYWAVYPDYPAAEFAQFVDLATAGAPYTAPILTANWGNLTSETKVALAVCRRKGGL